MDEAREVRGQIVLDFVNHFENRDSTQSEKGSHWRVLNRGMIRFTFKADHFASWLCHGQQI